jgi:hypothetical protein
VAERPVVGDPEEVDPAGPPRAGSHAASHRSRPVYEPFSSIGFTSVTSRVIDSSS